MTRIYQEPEDDMLFNEGSYSVDIDEIVLPSRCENADKCSSFSVCGALNLGKEL